MNSFFKVFFSVFFLFALFPTGCISSNDEELDYKMKREHMVSAQIEARGVSDPLVLDAMRKVQRHLFVPDKSKPYAYEDHPLPIGHDQTISQPYIVAIMTELIKPQADFKVLEIGTGSGYQAAVLAEIVEEVFTIEIIPELARHAETKLKELGYDNVHVRTGNGYLGWPEEAPFDAIIVTAAPKDIPPKLVEQLKTGARLVLPVGSFFQDLIVVVKTPDGFEKTSVIPVRFVPMVGKDESE
ncbi:MAG: protein-L-isoaspartate(D-aspartate) O-methyltransferase [Candidatus Aureabacteria bacterium]|nr:protein-L-isoaspartate(D-aspartate) O-methyltransferase [Candidatus Auribacterota bacterium]